jgi:hypothetical protein
LVLTLEGIEPSHITLKELCLNHLTTRSYIIYIQHNTIIIKLISFYPKNDLNVYDVISINLNFILSTSSSTRIFFLLYFKARMIWTLIWAIMSSLLYQLSYSLCLINKERKKRTKDLHLYWLGMSQLCYYYINPPILVWYILY